MNENVLKQLLGEMMESEFAEYDNTPKWKYSLKHRLAMKRIFARFERNAQKLKETTSETAIPIERHKPCYNFKQRLLITLCIISLMALLSVSAFAINSGVRSAIARITDPPLGETENGTILYQDDHFTIGARPVDTTVFEEIGEPTPTLVERNEYIDGGYKYIDEIYRQQLPSPFSGFKYWSWQGTHEIYDITDDGSIHLATLSIKGTFYVGEDQDVAIIDSDSVEYTAEKHVSGTYPVISASRPVCSSENKNDKGDPRSARIDLTVYFDNASSSAAHTVCIAVNSKNVCRMICDHN